MMRRDFNTLLGGLAAAPWILRGGAGRAQTRSMPVVGYLHFATADYSPNAPAFLQGLGDIGYVEGQNVAVEYRYAEGHYDRLPALAAELVGRKVDVIAAFGPPPARAAKNATSTIPIAFEVGNDPVASGMVNSLARPGGNATGVGILFTQLTAKRLEQLTELVPDAKVIAVLVNPNSPTAEPTVTEAQEAARAKGIQVSIVNARNEAEIDAAFASLAGLRADGLIVGADPFFDSRRLQLTAIAARYRIPTSYFEREFIALGGLISYGSSLTTIYRMVGNYAGRILKGEKPADLPVQQPTTFELVINRKIADTLGLTVPQALLAQANEVIE
jgi:putative ABC transport system substrate-binding protein